MASGLEDKLASNLAGVGSSLVKRGTAVTLKGCLIVGVVIVERARIVKDAGLRSWHRNTRNLPGRQTDVSDAQWWAELLGERHFDVNKVPGDWSESNRGATLVIDRLAKRSIG